MTAPRPAPERIDLTRTDDPRDVVHRTVASLAQGGVVALASPRHLVLAAGLLHPKAVHAVGQVENDPSVEIPTTLWLRGADELADWVPVAPAPAARLARRAWPGPVTLVFPAPVDRGLLQRLSPATRSVLISPLGLALGVPDSPFLRDVLRLLPGPVATRTFGLKGGRLEERISSLSEQARCGLVIEGLSDDLTDATTVALVTSGGWEVLRPGSVDGARLTQMAATILLFVCTGNTCRSPMAEALCKLLIAERLGCESSDLESRGYVVVSAGIAAISGMPAAANAIDVIGERGGSLAEHASRKLTLDLVRQADHILAMTADHLEALTEHVPEAAPRTRLLHPEGLDVADPVGADRDTYQETAEAIEFYLRDLLDRIGLPEA
jgi:L-threonylcarbamoyladenylate synthase